MTYAETKVAQHYYAGVERTNLSAYPLGVQDGLPYSVIVKTAEFDGHKWHSRQIFTGEDDGLPLNSWEDVLDFANLELKRLAAILTPLLNDDKIAGFDKFQQINNLMPWNNISEHASPESLFQKMALDDPETSFKTDLKKWLPVWVAWENFHAQLQKDINSGILIKL